MSDQVATDARAISPRGFAYLQESLSDGSPFRITPQELSQFAEIDELQSKSILDLLAENGVFVRNVRFSCSICETLGISSADYCQICDLPMTQGEILVEEIFDREGVRTRDISWLVLVHGMNTKGKWLPILNWYSAIGSGRSIPAYQHNYGVVLFQPFFPATRKRLQRNLRSQIEKHKFEAEEYGALPDIIAHSFGTWLVVNALLENKDLRVGKIILLGSIIDPSFDWSLIDGQYEKILIHRFQKDRIVGLLESKFILSVLRIRPFRWGDIGASGTLGFRDKDILEVISEEWGHSTTFNSQNIEKTLKQIWIPFLKSPD